MRWARCPSCANVLPEDTIACACGEDLSFELLPLERSDHPPPPRGRASAGRSRGRPGREGPRGSTVVERRVATGLGALLALLLAGGALSGPVAPPERPDDPAAPHPRPVVIDPGPPAYSPAGWSWKPVGPLLNRTGHVAAWTGREVVFWGGDRPGRNPDGAAYDPRADRWRRIATAPLANRFEAASAWTGRELVVWGGVNGSGTLADGAAYDPAADRWRILPESPLTGRVPLTSAWTGRELIVAGARGYGRSIGVTDAAAYDPRANEWRLLPPVPVEINEGTGAWTGTELVIFGGHLDRNRRPIGADDRARGAAFDPATGRWRPLATAPLSGQGIAFAWDGRQIVAWDYSLDSAAYDPVTDRWGALPDIPLKRRDCLPTGVAAGRVIFAQHCGQAAVFDPEHRTWTTVPSPRGATGAPVFTGEALVQWLGPSGRPHDGTWLRPLTETAAPRVTIVRP